MDKPIPSKLQSILKDLNSKFIKLHHQMASCQLNQNQFRHLIMYKDGTISLWDNKTGKHHLVTKKLMHSDFYNQLKEIAHIPLLINLISKTSCLTEELKILSAKLRELHNLLGSQTNMKMEIKTLGLKMTEASDKIILKIIDNSLAPDDLADYYQFIHPFQKELMKMATAEVLSNLEKTIKEWKVMHGLELKYSKAITAAPPDPNVKLAERQLLEQLYRRDLPDEKLSDYVHGPDMLVGEGSIEEKLISLIGTREVNKAIGKELLGDTDALSKDILADEALMWLNGNQPIKRCPYSEPRL